MNKKLIFIAPLILFILMVGMLFTGLGKDPTMLESQMIGKAIPEFNLPTLYEPNKIITHDDIKGPALINVFASWCPSCYTEHPYLMQLQQSGEVPIYGLNYKDTRPKGLKFVNDLGDPYTTIIFDERGRLGIEFGVYGAPETYVIDANNRIVYRHVGVVSDIVWQETIKPIIYPEESGQ